MATTPGAADAVGRWEMLVGGTWSATGTWLDVRSPYSGEIVSTVAWGGAGDARRAVDAAASAMRSPLPTARRAEILNRVSALIGERAEELAWTLCREAGKPITAARGEVERAAVTFALSAVEATKLAGEMIPLPEARDDARKLAFTVRKPVGVVGAITPFNFPLNLVAHKVAPAIAAGCAVVLKPAEKDPGAAVMLAAIAEEAGLPAGWLNLVVGPPEEISGVLVEDPRVRLLTFTGSADIGWKLAARAPSKRVTLELGNASPVIVEPDADVELAASKVAAGGFVFSGQSCISVQRVYVHRSLHERFLEELVTRVEGLVAGDPADPATDVGPLITREATARLIGWIDAARAGGARVLTGGECEGPVLRPTVLVDVDPAADVACREAFGPIVCVWPYDDFDEAIAAANGTDYGLQAAIFTRDIGQVMRAVRELDFGGVIVNDSPAFRRDEMPYGGVKQSGNTREGPGRAIREMTEECLVVLDA